MTGGILIAFLVGLAAGMLADYLADVLPLTRKLTHPACKNCKQPIGWTDYILFKSCKNCQQKRSLRSFITIIFMSLASMLLWLYQPAIGFWPAVLVAAYFCLVIVIDLEHRLVMHPVSIAGALIGISLGIWRHGVWNTLIGGLAGFAMMLVIYYIGLGFLHLVSKKKAIPDVEEAIGFGDVILSGVMGLFLGWPGVLGGLVITIVLGGIASLIFLIYQLIRKKYKAYSAIPYAPFIAIATFTLLLLARLE